MAIVIDTTNPLEWTRRWLRQQLPARQPGVRAQLLSGPSRRALALALVSRK